MHVFVCVNEAMCLQDIQLKVVILELLSVCVETQPGLIEMFINMQSKDKEKKQVCSCRAYRLYRNQVNSCSDLLTWSC